MNVRNYQYVLVTMQSVQAAVDHQLQAIAQNNSAQRVALVTFGDEVK